MTSGHDNAQLPFFANKQNIYQHEGEWLFLFSANNSYCEALYSEYHWFFGKLERCRLLSFCFRVALDMVISHTVIDLTATGSLNYAIRIIV